MKNTQCVEEVFGTIGISQATGRANGTDPLTIDIQNPPQSGQHWEVDCASAFGVDTGGTGADFVVSGLYIVQVGAPVLRGSPGVVTVNPSLLVTKCPALNINSSSGGAFTVVEFHAGQRFVVPSGYTIRAIWSQYNAAQPTAAAVMILSVNYKNIYDV